MGFLGSLCERLISFLAVPMGPKSPAFLEHQQPGRRGHCVGPAITPYPQTIRLPHQPGQAACLGDRPSSLGRGGVAARLITKLPASGRMFTDYSSNSNSSKFSASLTNGKFCDITVLFCFGVSFMQSYINHFSLDVSLRMALLNPELYTSFVLLPPSV